jgi:hypothetical protein
MEASVKERERELEKKKINLNHQKCNGQTGKIRDNNRTEKMD